MRQCAKRPTTGQVPLINERGNFGSLGQNEQRKTAARTSVGRACVLWCPCYRCHRQESGCSPGETVCLVLVDDEQRPGAQGWTRVWPNGVYQGIHSASKRIEWISASGTQQTDREDVRATMHGGGLSGGPRGRGPGRCKQDDVCTWYDYVTAGD